MLVFVTYLLLTEQNSRWPNQLENWGLAKPQLLKYYLSNNDFAFGSLSEQFSLTFSFRKHNHALPFLAGNALTRPASALFPTATGHRLEVVRTSLSETFDPFFRS